MLRYYYVMWPTMDHDNDAMREYSDVAVFDVNPGWGIEEKWLSFGNQDNTYWTNWNAFTLLQEVTMTALVSSNKIKFNVSNL